VRRALIISSLIAKWAHRRSYVSNRGWRKRKLNFDKIDRSRISRLHFLPRSSYRVRVLYPKDPFRFLYDKAARDLYWRRIRMPFVPYWKCTWKSHFSLASIITCSRVITSQDNFYRIVVAFSLKTPLITSEDDLWVAVAFEPSMENIH